jgi:hypothetical protein
VVRSGSSLSFAYLTMCAALHRNFVAAQRGQTQAQQNQHSCTTPHGTSADGISARQQLLLPSTAAVVCLVVHLWICCGGTVPACTSPKTYVPPSYDGSDGAAQAGGQAEGQAGCERAKADPEKHERRNNARRTFQCLNIGLQDRLQAITCGDHGSKRVHYAPRAPGTGTL